MKEDPFEQQIRAMRSRLDTHNLPEKGWDKIASDAFDPKIEKHTTGFNYWKIAAGFLLVLTVGLVFRLLTLESTPKSLGDLSPELRVMETNYQTQIDRLYSELPKEKAQTEQFEWIYEELALLDSIQQAYLLDLTSGKNQDKIIGVLIDHYEKKIKLLRKLELEIKRQQHENEYPLS